MLILPGQGRRKRGDSTVPVVGVEQLLPILLGARLRSRRQPQHRHELFAPEHLPRGEVDVEHTDLSGLLGQLQPVLGLLHGHLGTPLFADVFDHPQRRVAEPLHLHVAPRHAGFEARPVQAEQRGDLPYGAAAFPYNGTNPRARSLNFSDGGWGYSIPQGARNPDAAWEWQKYACAGEGNLKFFLAQGRPTPVKRHNERPEFKQASPYFDVLVATLHNQALAGVTPAWPEIRTVMTQMVADIGGGKVGPKDGLEDGAKQAQLLLDRAAPGGR